MKPRPLSKALEYMRPFVPLFLEHEQVLTEESRTNKAWHLGNKEFHAYSTLGGHVPDPTDDRNLRYFSDYGLFLKRI